MKNMLKKLGVIGIIVAILIPFTELPVVNAASDCKNYLQNYLFIDTAQGKEIDGTEKSVYSGSGHINYAQFPKVFAEGDVKITSVTKTMVSESQLSDFESQFTIIMGKAKKDKVYAYDDVEKGGVVFNSSTDSNYERNTLLAHANWGSYDEGGNAITSSWTTPLSDPYFIQKFIKNFNSVASVEISPAMFKNSKFNDYTETTDLKTFIQQIANDSSENDISFKIVRKLSSTDQKDTTYKTSAITAEDGYKEQGYYWPFVLNVEYQVCGANQATETWDLEYNENTDDDVTNMPSKKSDLELNKETDIDSRKPNREGYTFKNWCTNKDGTGDCYDAGGKITSSTSQTIILYAQWGKAGSEPQKPTGIGSYVLGFITVGLVAGGIYLVAKKKNLFKQI